MGATVKYQDSPAVNIGGGNPWKEVGTWVAAPESTAGLLSALGDVSLWLGLKNSDDQETRFDLRIEARRNGRELLATGEVYCLSGITRNPANAREAIVAFQDFSPVSFDGSGDVLSLRILTRILTVLVRKRTKDWRHITTGACPVQRN